LLQREDAMGTTIDAPATERVDATDGNNRWHVVTIVALAVGLVALGAWVLYDQAAEAETAAPAAVRELMDDYHAAWNKYDGDAFLAVVTEGYSFDNGMTTYGRNYVSSMVSGMNKASNVKLEPIGDLVVIGDGATVAPWAGIVAYYVATVNRTDRLEAGGDVFDGAGISTFVVVDTGDGLKIAEHHFVGNTVVSNLQL
jgi:ketosteroid isomerase-like protein